MTIELLVRGICCLRPGVPGVSENVEVHAIVDRFLEHGRIFSFANGGKEEVFITSADWMPRNFHRRVEVMVPIEDPALKARLNDILQVQIQDTVKAWRLTSNGNYERVLPKAGAAPLRSQQRFVEMTKDKVKIFEATQRTSGRFQLARPQLATKAERRARPSKK